MLCSCISFMQHFYWHCQKQNHQRVPHVLQVAIKEALSLEVLRSPQTSDVVPAKPISKADGGFRS